MKKFKIRNAYFLFALLLTVFMAGCSNDSDDTVTPETPPSETIPPAVTLTVPAATASEVTINSKIAANFSEEMTATTISDASFRLAGPGGTVVDGEVNYLTAVSAATFDPTDDLVANTIYTATITTGVTDLAGNPLAADKVWTFTTGTALDTTAPMIFSTDPPANATGVTTVKTVSVTFNESLDPATLTGANFTLAYGVNPPIPGTLTGAGQTATFTPTDGFEVNTTYTATITGVQDLAGNKLASDYVWSFTTAATAAAGPQAPELGEAGRFVILASQTVTTTSGSVLSGGDLGIMDQARSYYGGFTAGTNPGQFVELTGGLSYAHDDTDPTLIPAPYASTIVFIDQVRTDLGIAYDFLAADPNPGSATIACQTQLGGMILAPGVYKSAVNVLITDGPLHLDAQGDPNAVFIFTIDGNLTVGAPSGAIILDNGAQAGNVYFRTGGKTTIEAGRSFAGNIFAWSQINVGTGANITGRLFALIDQVTLISDAVTAP